MQISSKPQYKEVRFSSTSSKHLLKSFNGLTFLSYLSWWMQHDYNADPTLRQQSHSLYTAMGLRFLLAAWHRWGAAQAGPATIRISEYISKKHVSRLTFLTSYMSLITLPMHQSRLLKTVYLLHGPAFNTTGESTAEISTVLPVKAPWRPNT